MIKKIKASKFHVSRICMEAELEAATIVIKEEFAKLRIPQALIDFDNDLADLIVKRLMKVPFEEIERTYRDCTLAELIRDMVELEKKYPGPEPFPRLPSCYV